MLLRESVARLRHRRRAHPDPRPQHGHRLGIPVLGSADDVASVAAETGLDVLLSPAAPTPPPPRCAGSPGTSSSTTSRSSWPPASPTSPASGSGSVRSAACRSCTSRGLGRCTPARWGKRLFDMVGSRPAAAGLRAPCSLAVAGVIKLHDRGPVLFRQTRVGPRRQGVRLLQVPHHGHGRRGAARRAARASRAARAAALQDGGRPAHHQARHAGCAGSRSTSCPSCSTSSPAT